jgi:hypothetical protein
MDFCSSVESNGIKGQFLSNNETSNPASTLALRFKFHKENTIELGVGEYKPCYKMPTVSMEFQKKNKMDSH